MKFTNASNIPLPIAVWAVNDNYDYVDDPHYLSVTSLLKPVRVIILGKRVDYENLSNDVENLVASAMGTSIHDSIESAWLKNYKENLKVLGYADSVIDRFKINPETVNEGDIPIYIEQRNVKEFNGYKIGGKFDFVADGLLHDNKSTTAYKWTTGSSDEDYQLQGSLYRWLNPDKITEDFIRINFVFTDWQKLMAIKDSSYPQHRAMFKDIPLLSIPETEAWLRRKLDLVTKYWDAKEEDIPECTDEELWRTPTQYKYYANPEATRATKNFDNLMEANKFKAQKGKGIVKIIPGEARRCNYCSATGICSQFRRLHGLDECTALSNH